MNIRTGIVAGLALSSFVFAGFAVVNKLQNRHVAAAVPVPISVLAIRDCKSVLGVVIVTSDGVIHGLSGPFTAEQLANIEAIAKPLGDRNKATVNTPCAAIPGLAT